MVTLQSVQGHTDITHVFEFFDIRALWRSGLSARVPECQKIQKGGLDQYGAERFGRHFFATIRRKNVGLKGLIAWHDNDASCCLLDHLANHQCSLECGRLATRCQHPVAAE